MKPFRDHFTGSLFCINNNCVMLCFDQILEALGFNVTYCTELTVMYALNRAVKNYSSLTSAQ